MIGTIILALVLCAAVGLIVRYITDEISWTEYAIVTLILCPLVAGAIVGIGWNMAKKNLAEYHEYWNGWEMLAHVVEVMCTRDGPCIREYSCDPYTVTYSCNCDDDGCSTCTRTEYHDCPYATKEYDYYIDTTLGQYAVGLGHFAPNPIPWRSRSIPDGVPRGAPEIWIQAKTRIEAGVPGPVTKRMDYDNMILASDNTLLKAWSDDIDVLLDAGWLPDLERSVHTFYYADKVSFIGYEPENPVAWQNALSYLNAALGTERQGDLHLVIVQGLPVSPDTYINALKAYWQNPERFGKDAISKNSVIVAVGTGDGYTVGWARAETGMPLGNDAFITRIKSEMKGVPLTPEGVIGVVCGEFYENGSSKVKVRGARSGGALANLLWDDVYGFVRVSMSGDDPDDVGLGFRDLWYEIEPTVGQRIVMVLLSLVLCCSGWWIAMSN